MRVREIAALLGAPFEGDGELQIRSVASLDLALASDISFVSNRKSVGKAKDSTAGALIVPPDFPPGARIALIRSADPRAAIARVIELLHPRRETPAGIHASAILGPGVVLGPGHAVGPHAILGAGVHLGEYSSVGAGCSIGDYVRIGDRCVIHPNVTLYPHSVIGNRTVIHSGAVVGADGFGFVMREGAWHNFPQIGKVEIGDDVEIGANCTIDRAALGITSIGNGTKLDNMVHIGHNCRIGRHVVIAAQTGLAGGVSIDDYAVIGGQVGIGDKAHIESEAVLGSGAGVLTSKIVRRGQIMWGTPARPLREHLEQLAALSRLPGVLREWSELRKKLGFSAEDKG